MIERAAALMQPEMTLGAQGDQFRLVIAPAFRARDKVMMMMQIVHRSAGDSERELPDATASLR
jgi:hypothetical protein